MRITPIIVAQSREYHGPISTEHTILIRCAVGHIPSIRRIGEITTPIATIIASITMRNVFSLCFSIFVFLSCFPGKPVFFFCGQKKAQFPCFSVEVLLLPLTPKHGFPSLFSVCRVSGRSPSDPPASALSVHSLCYLNICRKMPASTVSYFLKAGKTDDNWISCK